MKKFFTSILVAVSFSGLVFACGGMTHVTSPSMNVTTEESTTTVESVVDHLQPIVVMC